MTDQPGTDDEFGRVADEIDQIGEMTRERLAGGELDRRREAIMDQVRGSTVPDMPLLIGGRNGPAAVQAMQVVDDLGQNMAVAAWIFENGGRLSHPLGSLDCAFKLYVDDGPDRARRSVSVQLGDVVVMVQAGVFAVLREVMPEPAADGEQEVPRPGPDTGESEGERRLVEQLGPHRALQVLYNGRRALVRLIGAGRIKAAVADAAVARVAVAVLPQLYVEAARDSVRHLAAQTGVPMHLLWPSEPVAGGRSRADVEQYVQARRRTDPNFQDLVETFGLQATNELLAAARGALLQDLRAGAIRSGYLDRVAAAMLVAVLPVVAGRPAQVPSSHLVTSSAPIPAVKLGETITLSTGPLTTGQFQLQEIRPGVVGLGPVPPGVQETQP